MVVRLQLIYPKPSAAKSYSLLFFYAILILSLQPYRLMNRDIKTFIPQKVAVSTKRKKRKDSGGSMYGCREHCERKTMTTK